MPLKEIWLEKAFYYTVMPFNRKIKEMCEIYA